MMLQEKEQNKNNCLIARNFYLKSRKSLIYLPFCYRLSKNYHPSEPDDLPCWAKADMLMNIALRRLEGFKIGRRQWCYPNLTKEDLAAVRRAVLCGLGMDPLKSAAD